MRHLRLTTSMLVALVINSPCLATGIAQGFGEELMVLTTARQAGSGGVVLEDAWRQGNFIEASSVLLASGLNWYGLGAQGGVGRGFRLGADGFMFSPSGIMGSRELSDGTFGGETGSIKVQSWGARLSGLWTLYEGEAWRIAWLGRGFGLVQQLPGVQNVGIAADLGLQVQRGLGAGAALTAWIYAGPLGWGGSRSFASKLTIGAGYLRQMDEGIFGGSNGYALGGEGDLLSDELIHGGLGVLYWFGRPSRAGTTFFLRGGVRYQTGSVQVVQPRIGLGFLWRAAGEYGFQIDYAATQLGELGLLHYVTFGIRLPYRI